MSHSRPRFQRLIRQAAREPLPPIDVAGRVVESIQRRIAPRDAVWPSWGAAGLAVAAAAGVLAIASLQGMLTEDPMVDWLRSLVMVMQ
ncbi:MAG: hypothetical protein JXB62_17985 [Pirellulales bacterium]|nr:hypothetical protein [Pirellulales bacterium]